MYVYIYIHTHCYIYIYIYISATVPLGTRGRVRSIVWVSDCLVFFVFKGAHTSGDGFTCLTCVPHFEHFSHHFFRPVFCTTTGAKMCQNGNLKKAQNRTNQNKTHQNAFLVEACKKTPAQGSQKGTEMGPKWNLRAPQLSKNQENWGLKKPSKNNTAKSWLLVDFGLKSDIPFSRRKRLRHHKHQRCLQNGLPGLQNELQGS